MEEDEPPGVPEWVVTYGDMMSLLLTFFIMLVSMAELKEEGRVRASLDALVERFGPDENALGGTPGRSLPRPTIKGKIRSDGVRSDGGTKRGSKNAPGARGAESTVEQIREGKQITLGGPAMFARFSADVGPELEAALDKLAEVVRLNRRIVAVRGHASPEPLPPGAEFNDHHSLAFARAESVAQYLVEHGIESIRVVTSSAGASEPRIRTRDAKKQRDNDRVDVFLVDSYTTST